MFLGETSLAAVQPFDTGPTPLLTHAAVFQPFCTHGRVAQPQSYISPHSPDDAAILSALSPILV
jgi:hypothetical protein